MNRLREVQPPSWPDLTPVFRQYVSEDQSEALLVVERGELLAVGAIIKHETSVWLAHILVKEGARGRGLGKQITEALMDLCLTHGYQSILLKATDLGEPVYRRLGFIEEMSYVTYKWNKDMFSKPDDIFTAYESKWEERIMALDVHTSGEQRYNTLRNHLSTSILVTDEEELLGAYFPSLGDGMIIANEAKAGISLMRLRLSDHSFALFPENNKAAIQFMKSQNIPPDKNVKRMFFGKPVMWHPECLYNRIGGNLG